MVNKTTDIFVQHRYLAGQLELKTVAKQCEQNADGGGGRTRTYEGVSQRIYSPPPLPLGTLPHLGKSIA